MALNDKVDGYVYEPIDGSRDEIIGMVRDGKVFSFEFPNAEIGYVKGNDAYSSLSSKHGWIGYFQLKSQSPQ